MIELAREARDLGFRAIGVTGGEPFLVSEMPELLLRLSELLPTIVLSNGTLFSGLGSSGCDRSPAARCACRSRSIDPRPLRNDEMRGPENFRKVVEGVPRLVQMGIGVRIASTLAYTDRRRSREALRAAPVAGRARRGPRRARSHPARASPNRGPG